MAFTRKMLLLIILTGIQSCSKKETVALYNQPKDFNEIFESFWFAMNKNYMFWDREKLNWNDVYTKFKPKFNSLDITSSSDLKRSVGYFRTITDSLLDGHFSITFTQPVLKDSIIYPAYFKIKSKNIPQISYIKIDTAYLDKGFKFAADNNYSFNGVPMFATCGTINGNILFFQCSSFNLFKSYNSKSASSVKPVLDYFFSQLENSVDLKGVIIDVRNNQGGDLNDLNFIVGRFIDRPLNFGFTRYKTGNGQFDYSPWIKSYINPTGNKSLTNLTKVVLSDRYSASMSEMVVFAIRSLPESFVVGDTTWGATGAVLAQEVYNAGQFNIEGFMDVKESSNSFKYINNECYEGKGFPPDYKIISSISDLSLGIDKQLEKAISLFK